MRGLFSKLSTLCLGDDALLAARQMAVSRQTPAHLGATPVEGGVHFSIYSRAADGVDLCLFDPAEPSEETGRVRMTKDDDDVWHAFVPGLTAGAVYGFRARGPWSPTQGKWFNPHKLLLDPYAKALLGEPVWQEAYQNVGEKTTRDFQDSGPVALKSVVISDEFDWQGDALPAVPWQETVIYELHVKGMTMQHPDVPPDLRGTYAGLADPSVISYLKSIGVTSVQLLPVHQHLDDGFLLAKGLTNYWGYNTIGFFAPHSEYAATRDPQAQVAEFKTMVRELHKAGIEVILDVVYNHTAEGDENGPMIFLRGLDNAGYYLLNNDHKVVNYTGCGNTLNAASPPALRLVMDSLRYWVQEMHIDGFRFDLGATMGRRGELFDIGCSFFQGLAQDPVLRRVKMIAEPWDLGPNGYQVGGFPKPWHELNGRFRDNVRCFWKGDEGRMADFAKRLCGSQDIYGPGGRPPSASVNFLTSHDGFTLRDLWSYNNKHNEDNGEENRDGDSHNNGWNCGIEGDTRDAIALSLRRRLSRSCMATLFLSQGVPFLTMGDERWRTQRGNNNGYCQDNPISWMDWTTNRESTRMLEFVKQLARFRQLHPVVRRAKFFDGRVNPYTGRPDIAWLCREGLTMSREVWHAAETRFIAAVLDDSQGNKRDKAAPILLLFNSSPEDIDFPMPDGTWTLVFDTSREPCFPRESDPAKTYEESFASASRSVACLVLKLT